MAENKIVIGVRIDRKQAEADLRALKADVTKTTRDLAALDKQITSASDKKMKLGESLKAATEAAKETEQAIKDLNQKMTLGKQYDELAARNEALTGTLDKQDQKVERLSADYKQFLAMRDKMGDSFTPEQADASERANADYKERLAAARAEAEATAAELEKVNAQLDQLAQQGAMPSDSADAGKLDALNAKLEKQKATVEQTTAEYKQQEAAVDALNNKHTNLNDTLQQQQAAVAKQTEQVNNLPASSGGTTAKGVTSTTKRLGLASKAASMFGKRLLRLSAAAFVFNLISKALRALVNGLGTALMKTDSVNKAFSRLKGAAATAAAGLANALAPVITGLINMVTALLNAFIRLISTITGQSIGAMKKQGQAIAATGSAAKKATKSLAAFDEINRLDDNSSSGGGADFSGVGDSIGQISDRMKELANLFKEGFKKGFGDAGEGLKNIKEDLAKIGATLKEIWTDPAVSAAVKRFTDTCAFALGEVVGAAASIGVSIAENLVGGMARYLERSKEFLKKILANIFNLGADLVGLFGDFAAAVATVFRSLGSEGAKQLTSGFIGMFTNAALGMIQTVEQVAYAIAKPLLQPFIDNAEKIREVFSNLFAVIAPFFVGIADGIAEFYTALGELYNNVVKPFIDGLAAANSGLLGQFLDGVNKLLEALTGTSDILHNIGELIGFFAGGILTVIAPILAFKAAVGMVSRAISVVSTVAKGASFVFGLLEKATGLVSLATSGLSLAFNPVVIGIGLAIAAGVLLYQHWDELKAAAGQLYQALYDCGQNIYTDIQNLKQTFADYFADVKQNLNDAGHQAQEYWGQMWQNLWQRMEEGAANIQTSLQTLKQNIADRFAQIKQDLNDWGHGLQADWTTFWANIGQKLSEAGAKLQTSFQTICAGAKTLFGNFCTGMKTLFSGFVSSLNTGLAALKTAFSTVWNGIVSVVQGAISRIISGVMAMVERITSAINGILSALGNMASRVSSGISSARSAISGHSLEAGGPPVALAGLPVPALAQGAVIPPNRKFLAMLGDQTGGTNVEAPLATIQQAMANVLGSWNGGSSDQPINIYIGEELLDSVIANSERRRNLRSGGR